MRSLVKSISGGPSYSKIGSATGRPALAERGGFAGNRNETETRAPSGKCNGTGRSSTIAPFSTRPSKFMPSLSLLARLESSAAIRTGKFPNTVSLSRELEVSRRPVGRDIEFIRDRLDAPIDSNPRQHGQRTIVAFRSAKVRHSIRFDPPQHGHRTIVAFRSAKVRHSIRFDPQHHGLWTIVPFRSAKVRHSTQFDPQHHTRWTANPTGWRIRNTRQFGRSLTPDRRYDAVEAPPIGGW
jgi:hypothetical protein